MAALLESLKQTTGQRKAEATARYRELLGRADNPQDGDTEALRECMGELGIAQADVAADLYALHEEQKLAGQVLPAAKVRELKTAHGEVVKDADARLRGLIHAIVDGVETSQLHWLWQAVARFAITSTEQWAKMSRSWDEQAKRIGFGGMELQNKLKASDDAAQQRADLRRRNPRLFDSE